MFMPTALKSFFDSVSQSSRMCGARDYISSNANGVVRKVEKIAKPYKEAAVDTMNQAHTFVTGKVQDVKQADSVQDAIEVIVGMLMSLFRLIVSMLKAVREQLMAVYRTKYSDTRQKVGVLVDDLKTRASDLPNSAVGKKVEVVSKRLLGDKRHDQTVDFLKTNVMPKVVKSYEKFGRNAIPSPSGSSNADLTTEGSVSAMSPAMSASRPKKTSVPRRK